MPVFTPTDRPKSVRNRYVIEAKSKHNNAERSIPAHPTFVNDAHPDLQLWPVASKIYRVYPLATVNISAKFDEEAHNGLVSIMFTSLFP